MGFFSKLFKDSEPEANNIELTINQLTERINKSLKKNNDLSGTDYVNKLFIHWPNIKKSINKLMQKKINKDNYVKAMIVSANNARNRISNQVNSLLRINDKPDNLEGLNKLIDSLKLSFKQIKKVLSYSRQALVIFKNEVNDVGSELESLEQSVAKINESINELNNKKRRLLGVSEQINKLNNTINELNKLKKSLINQEKELTELKAKHESIKSQLEQIKVSDSFRKNQQLISEFKKINDLKKSLERRALSTLSTLNHFVRKTFRDDDDGFINQLFNKPLKTINEQANEFNSFRSQLLKELNSTNDKNRDKIIDILNSHELKKLAGEFKNLELKSDKVKPDYSLIKKVDGLNDELRSINELIEQFNPELIKKEINKKSLLINKQKTLLEQRASECYDDNIIIRLQ